MPILADALQDAGCDNTDILDHCRVRVDRPGLLGDRPHSRKGVIRDRRRVADGDRPETDVDFLRSEASDRKLRLFACACHREAIGYKRYNNDSPHEVLEKKWIHAIEQFVEGKLSPVEWEVVRTGRTNTFHAHSHACYAASGAVFDAGRHNWHLDNDTDEAQRGIQEQRQTGFLRDIFGTPFRFTTIDPSWLTSTVLALTIGIYEENAFDRFRFLAMPLKMPVAPMPACWTTAGGQDRTFQVVGSLTSCSERSDQ